MIEKVTIQINGKKLEFTPDEFKALGEFFNRLSGKQNVPPVTIQPPPFDPSQPPYIITADAVSDTSTKTIDNPSPYKPGGIMFEARKFASNIGTTTV